MEESGWKRKKMKVLRDIVSVKTWITWKNSFNNSCEKFYHIPGFIGLKFERDGRQ